jgi:hypothetical protein
VRQGYARGVSMGGELKSASQAAEPRFTIMASKGANDHNVDSVHGVKS